MSRPKGSKNKPKMNEPNSVPKANVPDKELFTDKLPVIKRKETKVAVDPNGIWTKTINGTPIVIVSICGSSTDSTMFMVIVDPNKKGYRTAISSTDLLKPTIYPNPDVEKEFSSFKWGSLPVKKEPEVIETKEINNEETKEI